MGLPLDTHIFYWFIIGAVKLSADQRRLIGDRSQPIFVSAVTGWEIASKVKLGKWPEAASLLPDLPSKIIGEGFQMLDITMAQAEFAGSLPLVHRDPFDRFLAAQSLLLDIPIATVDAAFTALGCKVV